jgi:hypothetical protein
MTTLTTIMLRTRGLDEAQRLAEDGDSDNPDCSGAEAGPDRVRDGHRDVSDNDRQRPDGRGIASDDDKRQPG